MKFSQRHGYTSTKKNLQREAMDLELRNSLWSAMQLHYWDDVTPEDFSRYRSLASYKNQKLSLLCKRIWLNYFKRPLDNLSDDWDTVLKKIREHFFAAKWFAAYDFIEFVSQSFPDDNGNEEFRKFTNGLLEREVAAYRFIDGKIAEITAKEEVEEIESALADAPDAVRGHLDRALILLSDRRSPDYRNSIKESISAVEALVMLASAPDKGTFATLLKKLSAKHPLHSALEGAFSKLYGYTSDAKGIRHALLEQDTVAFEEAKFMLVACSAFINYVRSILKT